MIKIITKDSKVSKRNMIKSLKIVKKFMRMLRIMLMVERRAFKKWLLDRIFFVV